MRSHARTVLVAAAVLAWGCSSESNPGNPAGPSNNPPPASGGDAPITITIVGDRGAQSFSPSPATVPEGRTVVWRNTDVLVHRVMLNDGSIATGDIAPGASSTPLPLGGVAKPYHCPLHPGMIGSLNGAPTEDPPPCYEPYC